MSELLPQLPTSNDFILILICRLWLNNHGLCGFGDNRELFYEFGVGFGEGFAIELFIDLFDAFPGADTFDAFVVAA